MPSTAAVGFTATVETTAAVEGHTLRPRRGGSDRVAVESTAYAVGLHRGVSTGVAPGVCTDAAEGIWWLTVAGEARKLVTADLPGRITEVGVHIAPPWRVAD